MDLAGSVRHCQQGFDVLDMRGKGVLAICNKPSGWGYIGARRKTEIRIQEPHTNNMFLLEFLLRNHQPTDEGSSLVRQHRLLNTGMITQKLQNFGVFRCWMPIVGTPVSREHMQVVGPTGASMSHTVFRYSRRDLERLRIRMHNAILHDAIDVVVGRGGGNASA